MKYIAKYASVSVSPTAAQAQHESEYYRTPHGWCNGTSLGEFVETARGVQEYIYGKGVYPIKDEWLRLAASDLFAHLKANTAFEGIAGINGFSVSNCLPREVLGLEENHGFQLHLTIGAGYTAYISQDGSRVLAEAYIACSGNAVVVVHKEDESILYVNSRRHGIPALARVYMEMEPYAVVMYDSLRTDAKWYQAGLEHPNTGKEVIDGNPYEDIGWEIEARLL